MKRLWREYGLSLVLWGQFALSLAIYTVAAYHRWLAQPEGAFGWIWWAEVMENWQSEAMQIAVFVWASARLIHRGSPQSKDGDDQMQDKLDRILARLERKQDA